MPTPPREGAPTDTARADDAGDRRGDSRLAVPADLVWMRDEAGLRPPAIARVVGVTPSALARWTDGAWAPTAADVPLLAALAHVHAQVCRLIPEARARCRWWVEGRRALGWLSPAEVLRRGKLGELLRLIADPDGDLDA